MTWNAARNENEMDVKVPKASAGQGKACADRRRGGERKGRRERGGESANFEPAGIDRVAKGSGATERGAGGRHSRRRNRRLQKCGRRCSTSVRKPESATSPSPPQNEDSARALACLLAVLPGWLADRDAASCCGANCPAIRRARLPAEEPPRRAALCRLNPCRAFPRRRRRRRICGPSDAVPPGASGSWIMPRLYGRKLYDLAIPEFEKYLEQYPGASGRANALFLSGRMHRALKRPASARTEFPGGAG